MEQAADAPSFFKLDNEEEEFLFLLISLARAGTRKLRFHFEEKIRKVKERCTLLSNRIEKADTLDEITQSKYYSHWYYAAIHMIVTIPECQTKDKIASYLNLPHSVLNEALHFLLEAGLINETKDGYTTGRSRIFLRGDSQNIVQHHENWRLKAIENITLSQNENIHFSSVYTLSKKDFLKIKEKLLNELEEMRAIIKPSREEELCIFNLDFFKLHKAE